MQRCGNTFGTWFVVLCGMSLIGAALQAQPGAKSSDKEKTQPAAKVLDAQKAPPATTPSDKVESLPADKASKKETPPPTPDATKGTEKEKTNQGKPEMGQMTSASIGKTADQHIAELVIAGIAVLAVMAGGGYLLYYAAQPLTPPAQPFITRLGPSFFFWLGMIYLVLLLIIAAAYTSLNMRWLIGGILPAAVPWFGALGAVTISVEGVFLWNKQWDNKFNYWHIGRPLFGAVLGIVAFFMFVLIVKASGTSPAFLTDTALTGPNGTPKPASDFVIYYVLAFVVGYREETFRELIKRATDLILQPGSPAPAPTAPVVVFKVAGTVQPAITCPPAAANATTRIVVEIHNTGTAPLVAPRFTVAPKAPTPANVFGIQADHVTGGGDLAPNAFRTVDITFTPQAATTPYSGILTVNAANLAAPKTIDVAGTSQ